MHGPARDFNDNGQAKSILMYWNRIESSKWIECTEILRPVKGCFDTMILDHNTRILLEADTYNEKKEYVHFVVESLKFDEGQNNLNNTENLKPIYTDF